MLAYTHTQTQRDNKKRKQRTPRPTNKSAAGGISPAQHPINNSAASGVRGNTKRRTSEGGVIREKYRNEGRGSTREVKKVKDEWGIQNEKHLRNGVTRGRGLTAGRCIVWSLIWSSFCSQRSWPQCTSSDPISPNHFSIISLTAVSWPLLSTSAYTFTVAANTPALLSPQTWKCILFVSQPDLQIKKVKPEYYI